MATCSQPRSGTALLESEAHVERYARCPRCHTTDSRAREDALATGDGWHCGRCGQYWDAPRLGAVAAYERWSLEHDHVSVRHAPAQVSPPPPDRRSITEVAEWGQYALDLG